MKNVFSENFKALSSVSNGMEEIIFSQLDVCDEKVNSLWIPRALCSFLTIHLKKLEQSSFRFIYEHHKYKSFQPDTWEKCENTVLSEKLSLLQNHRH